jgi:hypothetical protein
MDGEILINQARVQAGQITPGDTPGFPVTISKPGSYRLSGNLTVPRGVNGIVITVSNVTLNLNGFQIALESTGPGYGITDNGVALTGVTLRNGTICSFDEAINLIKSQVVIENIQIPNGADQGILAGPCSMVKNNVVARLGLSGITAGADSIITGNVVSNCYGSAIAAGSGSIVCNNSVSDNRDGINVGTNCIVKGNTSLRNQLGGITVGAGSTVMGNTASNCRTGLGIDSPCTVIGNTSVNNTQNMVVNGQAPQSPIIPHPEFSYK